MDGGGRGGGVVPQAVLEAGVRVVGRGGRGRRRHEIGEGHALGEGVQAHEVKVAGGQGLGVVGAGVEGLGQLVQGAVEGRFEDAGGAHARGQTQGVDDLLGAGIWGQLTSGRTGTCEQPSYPPPP